MIHSPPYAHALWYNHTAEASLLDENACSFSRLESPCRTPRGSLGARQSHLGPKPDGAPIRGGVFVLPHAPSPAPFPSPAPLWAVSLIRGGRASTPRRKFLTYDRPEFGGQRRGRTPTTGVTARGVRFVTRGDGLVPSPARIASTELMRYAPTRRLGRAVGVSHSFDQPFVSHGSQNRTFSFVCARRIVGGRWTTLLANGCLRPRMG